MSAAAIGLSMAHNGPLECVLEVAREGSLVTRYPLKGEAEALIERRGGMRIGGGVRGRIREFTRASRWRLIQKVAGLKSAAMEGALFVTLTYHYAEDAENCERDLRAFWKRLQRRFPEAAALWKKEYQQRGVAHFHLLLFGVSYVSHYDVATWWAEVVGSRSLIHKNAGTQIEAVKSGKQARFYMAKYVEKGAEVPEHHRGRFWGIYGAMSNFASERVFIPVSRAVAVQSRRVFDAIRAARSSRPFRRACELGCLQRFLLDGEAALSMIRRLVGDRVAGEVVFSSA